MVKIPFAVKWLGRAPDVKTRYKEGAMAASSTNPTVVWGEAINHLHKNGLRLLGRCYGAETFREARPDSGVRPLLLME